MQLLTGIDNKALAQGHLKRVTRTVDAVSDVSEEEEGDCSSDDANDEEMPMEASKTSSKLQFPTSTLASAASKLSSSSMSKIKKGGSQKTGDLHPLTKSAYASVRNSATAKPSMNGVPASGSSKSKELGKSGIKKDKEKSPESRPTSSQRIYTYKSGKNAGGDASTVSENSKENDVDMDDSSSSSEDDDEEEGLQNQEANRQIASRQTSNNSNSPRTKQQKKVVNVLELLKTGGNLG